MAYNVVACDDCDGLFFNPKLESEEGRWFFFYCPICEVRRECFIIPDLSDN